ncbi:hypothetical protein AUR04nite_22380 [Glutamicibacter uratoxydans]|uniref:DUF885 domain-containing protein n=1 Tax=Glutamicibacter uratoxydans TaxID=43667 RepID=A0A4Y4DP58_GLUUR|nr:DUF885 domain-containing protein [Glutamicibacter uratoxydans]GED06706.1 hypothetical protein AUR04nite_22380 [Glutamicibacter uratoxydans]
MTSSATQREPSRIDEIAEAFFSKTLEINPEFGVSLGIPGYESGYSDYSPAGSTVQINLLRETLALLEQAAPVDAIDEVTLDAMTERLGLDLEILLTGRTELNNIASPAQGIRAIIDLMPQETSADYGFIAARLANIPAAIDGYIASLRDSASKSLVAARRQVQIVTTQSKDYGKDGGFFDQLAEAGTAVDASLESALASGTEAAKQAYLKLADFLENELLDQAPEVDAVGREYYSLMSRQFLGATVDLEETYAWGVAELDAIIAEQERTAQLIKPGATIEEAKQILNQDPARKLDGTDALKAWMQEKADKAIADLSGVHFDIPAPMDRIECMIAPTQDGGIYYTGPSEDFSRPGRMWWSVPPGEDQFTTWAELTTVYHEGVPGHHLQVATAQLQADTLNSWRRMACWVSGHGEGWALYSERLMHSLGYLADPGDYMGMLDAQRMRAARVVFDIGVHLSLPVPEQWGTGTWNSENGYDFLKKNLDISEGQLDFEYTRYLGWPGQAPAYKVGQRLWEQIRDTLEAEQGEQFSLKDFHTKALQLGSVGLDTLKRALVK